MGRTCPMYITYISPFETFYGNKSRGKLVQQRNNRKDQDICELYWLLQIIQTYSVSRSTRMSVAKRRTAGVH